MRHQTDELNTHDATASDANSISIDFLCKYDQFVKFKNKKKNKYKKQEHEQGLLFLCHKRSSKLVYSLQNGDSDKTKLFLFWIFSCTF